MISLGLAVFPSPDGCEVCRGYHAYSPQDAKGAGCRVRVVRAGRWAAFCGFCGRLTGRGPYFSDGVGITDDFLAWDEQR